MSKAILAVLIAILAVSGWNSWQIYRLQVGQAYCEHTINTVNDSVTDMWSDLTDVSGDVTEIWAAHLPKESK